MSSPPPTCTERKGIILLPTKKAPPQQKTSRNQRPRKETTGTLAITPFNHVYYLPIRFTGGVYATDLGKMCSNTSQRTHLFMNGRCNTTLSKRLIWRRRDTGNIIILYFVARHGLSLLMEKMHCSFSCRATAIFLVRRQGRWDGIFQNARTV